MAAIAPWVALHVPHYLEAVAQPGATAAASGASSPTGRHLAKLFSNQELFWGGTALDYGVVVFLLAAACAIAVWNLRRNSDAASHVTSVTAAALGGASVIAYLLNVVLLDVPTAIRYSTPILIAALPATAILLARPLAVAPTGSGRAAPAAIVTALATVFILFSGELLHRIRVAASGHTLVAFPTSELYYSYMAGALGAPARDGMLRGQMLTAEHATILAWTSTPFHLDFRRNRILVVSEPGLINPWLHLAEEPGPETLRKYLVSQQVRYVLLEYAGTGIKSDEEFISYLDSPYVQFRRIAAANLSWRRGLLALAERSRIIGRGPEMVLYEIAAPDG
jgi:hypothetical protein